MSLAAFAGAILPGRKEQWERFRDQITGPRKADFDALRRRAGVRERTFHQQAPDGTEMVIVTLEGEDPQTALSRMATEDTDFARWFAREVIEIHGFDPRQPLPGPPPVQIVDTGDISQENANLFRHFIDELVNKANLAIIDAHMAPDFVEREVLPPGIPPGPEGVRALFTMIHAAFPGIRAEVENVIAQGDKVLCQSKWRGTNTGPFMGMPPTGKEVAFQVFDVVRIVNGKIGEHWGLLDMMGLMQQLGAIPAPEGSTV